MFLDSGDKSLTWAGSWACSPNLGTGKTREGQKMPETGLWIQGKQRPWSRPSSIPTDSKSKVKLRSTLIIGYSSGTEPILP